MWDQNIWGTCKGPHDDRNLFEMDNGIQVAMRALECDVKKAEVSKLMQKYSKEDNNEIGSHEFMKISEPL